MPTKKEDGTPDVISLQEAMMQIRMGIENSQIAAFKGGIHLEEAQAKQILAELRPCLQQKAKDRSRTLPECPHETLGQALIGLTLGWHLRSGQPVAFSAFNSLSLKEAVLALRLAVDLPPETLERQLRIE